MGAATSTVCFYLIESDAITDIMACRLCFSVAIKGQNRLFVRCDSAEQVAYLDDFLWTYKAESFVAHAVDDPRAAVCIGLQAPDAFVGCCLNLASDSADPARFERIFELIGNSDSEKQQGRTRFKAYRAQGIVPSTQKI